MINLQRFFLLILTALASFLLFGCSTPQEELEIVKERESRLVWSDEFDYEGLPDPERWGYDVGGSGWGNRELQYYTERRPENAVVKDGRLIITARRESHSYRDYTSARLVTRGKAGWLFGRIEVRAKLPSGRGTWPAIWMMPVENRYGQWPNSGEIDIMEHVGYDPGVIHASIHSGKYNHRKGTQRTATAKADDFNTTFHTYSVEWRPGTMDFYLDDQKYMTRSFNAKNDAYDGPMAWPFDRSFYLILNIAAGGEWGGAKGVDPSVFPQTMEVDYVRVYDLGIDPGLDKQPPAAPDGLVLGRKASGYTLSWKASQDNYAVSYYIVEMNGKTYRSTFLNSVDIVSLKAGDKRKFRVIAVDYNGNKSSSKTVKLECK